MQIHQEVDLNYKKFMFFQKVGIWVAMQMTVMEKLFMLIFWVSPMWLKTTQKSSTKLSPSGWKEFHFTFFLYFFELKIFCVPEQSAHFFIEAFVFFYHGKQNVNFHGTYEKLWAFRSTFSSDTSIHMKKFLKKHIPKIFELRNFSNTTIFHQRVLLNFDFSTHILAHFFSNFQNNLRYFFNQKKLVILDFIVRNLLTFVINRIRGEAGLFTWVDKWFNHDL